MAPTRRDRLELFMHVSVVSHLNLVTCLPGIFKSQLAMRSRRISERPPFYPERVLLRFFYYLTADFYNHGGYEPAVNMDDQSCKMKVSLCPGIMEGHEVQTKYQIIVNIQQINGMLSAMSNTAKRTPDPVNTRPKRVSDFSIYPPNGPPAAHPRNHFTGLEKKRSVNQSEGEN